MNSIKLKSRAKVNLSIDVLGKRQDGYHLVEMIMQTIDLYDLIEIKEKEENQITIKSASEEIPLDCNNLVYKAADLIKKTFNLTKGVEIYIQKNTCSSRNGRWKFKCSSYTCRFKQTLEFKFK